MFADDLRALGACEEAVEWVGKRTLAQAWRECREPQWMLWLLHQIHVDARRCGGLFALRVWHLVDDEAKLVCAWAIDCALRGADDDEEVAAACTAAYAAADAAADAAACAAAYAAAYAAYSYVYSYAAADAAANAAADAAELRAQCAIIREEIPLAMVRAALNRRMKQ